MFQRAPEITQRFVLSPYKKEMLNELGLFDILNYMGSTVK